MRSPLLALALILPAAAELEVVSSQLVSRRPDGIGEVVQADLDGDGDDDLIVTGKRNDFLGWIESTAQGPTSELRPIDTGNFPVQGQRPAVADLDETGLPQIHFSGWSLPNLFRKFGPPQARPETAGKEVLAGLANIVVLRDPASGEWLSLRSEGAASVGGLRTPARPAPGTVLLGHTSRTSTPLNIDLIAVLKDAANANGPLSGGVYLMGGAGGGFGKPFRISSSKPRLLAPVTYPSNKARLTAVMAVTDSPGNPENNPPIPFSVLSVLWQNPQNEWVSHLMDAASPRIESVAAIPAYDVFDIKFVMAVNDVPGWNGLWSLKRYHTVLDYGGFPNRAYPKPVYDSSHPLTERGDVQLQPSGTGGALLATFPSKPAALGAETIRRIRPEDFPVTAWDPGSPPDSRLVAGPFGELASARWQNLSGDAVPELLASSSGAEAMLIFARSRLQSPAALSFISKPDGELVLFNTAAHTPPFAGDFDNDGDTDLLGPTVELSFSARVCPTWENLGSGFDPSFPQTSGLNGYQLDGYLPLRLEQDAATNRTRVIWSKPGAVLASWLHARWDDPPLVSPAAYPGTGARVIAADQDIDGDGDLDFVFYPSVYGNTVAWGQWNPAGGYLDSLEQVASFPVGTPIPELKSGDLDGDGHSELYHAILDITGTQVSWAAFRKSGGTLVNANHPALTLPAAASRVLPADVDGDGDTDLLRLAPESGAPDQGDGIRSHEVRWTEYLAGAWIHHTEVLGKLRTSPGGLEPLLRTEELPDGSRLLIANRIGEILEIRTRAGASPSVLALAMAGHGLSGTAATGEGDPDGDGIPNFAEILGGTSPVVADDGFKLPLQMISAGANHGWHASLPVSLADFGARARLETSEDLAEWTRHEAEPLPLGQQEGHYRYFFTDEGLAARPRHRFARIVFTLE